MYRIGNGYDVHRLVEGRKLILGGVEIESIKGLEGHSDADVLVHSIMDSILGAIGEGDIGKHFPDTDEKYRGISSLKLLENVVEKVRAKGYEVVNVDSIVIMQKPKIAKYIEDMRRNIARTMGIEEERVNVKATTEEGLGYTGKQEGVSSQAVSMVRKTC